jgi:hypothetical protein
MILSDLASPAEALPETNGRLEGFAPSATGMPLFEIML